MDTENPNETSPTPATKEHKSSGADGKPRKSNPRQSKSLPEKTRMQIAAHKYKISDQRRKFVYRIIELARKKRTFAGRAKMISILREIALECMEPDQIPLLVSDKLFASSEVREEVVELLAALISHRFPMEGKTREDWLRLAREHYERQHRKKEAYHYADLLRKCEYPARRHSENAK